MPKNQRKSSVTFFSFTAPLLLFFIGFVFYVNTAVDMRSPPPMNIEPMCVPREKNDCPPEGAKVLKTGGTLEGSLGEVRYLVADLPKNSWYKREPSNDLEKANYQLIVYPDVGAHDFQLPHDFKIEISVKSTVRKATTLTCIKPVGYDDLRDETIQNGKYDITVRHSLNYRGYGEQGGNPNPYDFQIKDLLLTITKGLRVGDLEAC